MPSDPPQNSTTANSQPSTETAASNLNDDLQNVRSAQQPVTTPTQVPGEDNRGDNKPTAQPAIVFPHNENPVETKLPDRIPAGWLTDIKNAVKESRTKLIVTTILGSSLLTGILTTIGNYYLEDRKSKLEFNRLLARDVLTAYTALGGDIQELENRVIVARVTALKAVSDPSKVELSKDQITELANQIAVVQNRIKQQEIDSGRGTRELIEKWINPVGDKIPAVQRSSSNEALTEIARTLDSIQRQGISEIKNHITNVKQSLKETLTQ